MVSGSAALPASVAERWAELSGQRLLERYGMTEFAMAISNPVDGERRLNAVGMPLPGFEVRLAGLEPGAPPPPPPDGFAAAGELQLRGPGVFSEYWGKPEATRETFSDDGWFKTGDFVRLSCAGGKGMQGTRRVTPPPPSTPPPPHPVALSVRAL
jgi:malonyl-CoA/methylmalonyl-CoA synthetase